MMKILTELTLYPIKSCCGVALQEATITDSGLASGSIQDREWMVVDAQGQFVTQRTHPKMAIITPILKANMMELSAHGTRPLAIPIEQPDPNAPSLNVRIWRDAIKAQDCGDEAASWMSQVVGDGCRLVRFHPHANRTPNTKWTGGIEAHNMFSDSYPFLVLSQESLDDLNQRLLAHGRDAIPMNRFRPNIVIGNVPSYEEDRTHSIRMGDAVLQLVRPCQRCPVPSVDQATGIVGPDPLDILKTYHTSEALKGAVTFGMHAILLQGTGETLRVGQRIEMSSTL
jgi:uncharacterized protein YcbX